MDSQKYINNQETYYGGVGQAGDGSYQYSNDYFDQDIVEQIRLEQLNKAKTNAKSKNKVDTAADPNAPNA